MGRVFIFVSAVGVVVLVLIVLTALLAVAGVDRFDTGFNAAS